MGLYREELENLKNAREKRLRGENIAIPWFRLPRLSKVLPGIVPETLTEISANQKVGKTQMADYLYLYMPIDWLFEHRNSNLDVEIIYFSLEMSKQAKIRQAMSYRLFTKYGISVSPQKLRSIFDNYIVDDKILKLIDAEREWFDFFESKVTFVDDLRNGYGIYKYATDRMNSQGTIEYIERNFKVGDKIETHKVRNKIIYNNPNKIFIIITDHISLLQPEKVDGGSLYSAIGRFSSEYCLNLRDFYKACVCNVHQQAPTSESVDFYRAKAVIEKARPSSDGLADNKSTARDANLIIFLFNPSRYGARDWGGLDLELFKGGHRELTIGINRDGIDNASLDLYFNGSSNYFEEIPENITGEFVKRIEEIESKRI